MVCVEKNNCFTSAHIAHVMMIRHPIKNNGKVIRKRGKCGRTERWNRKIQLYILCIKVIIKAKRVNQSSKRENIIIAIQVCCAK